MARLRLASALLLLGLAAATPSGPLQLTTRRQYMSAVGRQEWVQNNTVVAWNPNRTGIVVVDMWDVHWCAPFTTRVGELAVPMQQWVAAARARGVSIIWAPSAVTGYYQNSSARKNTLALPLNPMPTPVPVHAPDFPLDTSTDGGCETPCKPGAPWTRQIDTLKIEESDFLISADVPGGTQELWNIAGAQKLENLMYVGVAENMCIMGRPFAIQAVRSLGWPAEQMAVVRELVDVMYTPKDKPYVSHAEGLQIHTAYLEKFWATSVSMYDILAPSYKGSSEEKSSFV